MKCDRLASAPCGKGWYFLECVICLYQTCLMHLKLNKQSAQCVIFILSKCATCTKIKDIHYFHDK